MNARCCFFFFGFVMGEITLALVLSFSDTSKRARAQLICKHIFIWWNNLSARKSHTIGLNVFHSLLLLPLRELCMAVVAVNGASGEQQKIH